MGETCSPACPSATVPGQLRCSIDMEWSMVHQVPMRLLHYHEAAAFDADADTA